MFQFQSGAIKGVVSYLEVANVTGFQFQSGAIKGRGQVHRPEKVSMFQFQSGAIKGRSHEDEAFPAFGFNSSLVRLKASGNLSKSFK